ncbi:hypothetical protein BH10CYA1_BH10CYA1_60040 [soil metagenome]
MLTRCGALRIEIPRDHSSQAGNRVESARSNTAPKFNHGAFLHPSLMLSFEICPQCATRSPAYQQILLRVQRLLALTLLPARRSCLIREALMHGPCALSFFTARCLAPTTAMHIDCNDSGVLALALSHFRLLFAPVHALHSYAHFSLVTLLGAASIPLSLL